MKVIDAVWEKENLGVETKEVVIDHGDCKRNALKFLETVSAEYVVVKIPSEFPMSFPNLVLCLLRL